MRLARRHFMLACACALTASGTLALPAGAAADTATTGGPTGGTAAPSDAPPTKSTGDVALTSSPGALVNRSTRLRGAVPARLAGHIVVIQLLHSDGSWTTVAQAVTDSTGRFAARWRPGRSGRFTLRAAVGGAGRTRATPAAAIRAARVT